MAAHNRIFLGKANFYTYNLLNVLLFLEPERCNKFLFGLNCESRSFLEHNYPTVNRAFENEGLAVKNIEMTTS